MIRAILLFVLSVFAFDALACADEPAPDDLVPVPMGGEGLIGVATLADGDKADTLFHYVHGKVFNPEAVRDRIDGAFALALQGELKLPHDMEVQIWHAGGGVSHDINTLFVAGKKISMVGDDRSKHSVDLLKLEKGSHRVLWMLQGGTFRHNLLKFVDPDTGEMLSLVFKAEDAPDVPIREVLRVGQDERGWPIPADW